LDATAASIWSLSFTSFSMDIVLSAICFSPAVANQTGIGAALSMGGKAYMPSGAHGSGEIHKM
jgi:hypothetical protein